MRPQEYRVATQSCSLAPFCLLNEPSISWQVLSFKTTNLNPIDN